MRFTHERLHGGASSEAPLLHVFHVDTLQEFSYNEHGGVVRSVLRHADAQTPQIVSGTAYQHNGNHILSQTDARGKTVTHDIDENTDLTRAVTDPNGQQVQYAYDSARRVTQVSASAGGKQYKNAYAYENDRLKTVSHNTDGSAANDVTYRFAYDAVGRPTETHVGSRLLSRNVYNADGTLQKVTYGNSSAASAQEVMYGYDDFRRLKDVRFGGDTAPRYEYAYNARGGVAWVRNNRLNTIARSDYDFGGRPRSMVTQDASGANVYTARVDYDTCGRLARFAEQVGASRAAYETTFGYDREDRPTALTYGSSASKTETAYDGLGRLSTRKVYVNGSAYTTAYAYAPGAESGQTTALVQEITQPGENHSYAYDNVGNIVSAARNGVTTTYAYDALGQLIRVNDPNDGTWTYEYDCGGNILNKKQYAYTTGTLGTVQQIVSYAYGDADWKDKLTRYNGVDIAYDAIGNPIQDGVWTYTWENGRQLRRMACDATIAEFVYNADGLRVQKTVNGVTTNYTLHGKNIVHMTKGNAELHFWYDAQNRPAIVEFNGTKYGYLYNLQGDVIGLIDSANTEVVKYTYDAWGKPLSVTGSLANTIGYYNPFRYRGYVYDVETGLYYLRSRYYNPSWGRFVNADTLFNNNLYSYCNNRPAIMADSKGTSATLVQMIQYDNSQSESYFRRMIWPQIEPFIHDAKDYKYNDRYFRLAKYKNGKLVKSGYTDCSHLMYEITGQVGSCTAPYRYKEYRGDKGRLFDKNGMLMVDLVEGMEVYNKSIGHVGMLLLYDFGDGLEWAVFQSAEVPITKSKALFSDDTGPNISSFYQKNGKPGNWYYYTMPRYDEDD